MGSSLDRLLAETPPSRQPARGGALDSLLASTPPKRAPVAPEPSALDRLESAGAGAAHMLGSLVNAPFEAFGKMISPAAGADTDAANDPNSLANQRFAARFGHDAPHVEGVTGRERGVAAIETAANVLFPGAAEAASEHIAVPLLSRLATVPGSANAVARLGTIGGEMIAGGAVAGVDAAAQGQDARGIALSAAGGAVLPAAFHAGGAAIGAGLRAVGRGYANVAAEMGARAADRLQAEPTLPVEAPTPAVAAPAEAPAPAVPDSRAGRMMAALTAPEQPVAGSRMARIDSRLRERLDAAVERPRLAAGSPADAALPSAPSDPITPQPAHPALDAMLHEQGVHPDLVRGMTLDQKAQALLSSDGGYQPAQGPALPLPMPAHPELDALLHEAGHDPATVARLTLAEKAQLMLGEPARGPVGEPLPDVPADPVPASVQAAPAHIESAPELAAAQPSEAVQAASAEVPTAPAEPPRASPDVLRDAGYTESEIARGYVSHADALAGHVFHAGDLVPMDDATYHDASERIRLSLADVDERLAASKAAGVNEHGHIPDRNRIWGSDTRVVTPADAEREAAWRKSDLISSRDRYDRQHARWRSANGMPDAPATDAAPAPEPYKPTIKFDTARRPGDSRLRPAHELVRTSDDGLLQEYVQQHQQIQTDLPRTVYHVNEGFGAEGQEGSMRAGGTRLTKNGPTEQSKAMTRIAQAQAVQEKIVAEMERRGMSRGDLHDTAMARAAEQADGDAAAQAALQGDAPYFGEPVDTVGPAGPTVGPDGTLRDVSGAVLFANPIGPALRHFAQPALRTATGAVLGGLAGGAIPNDPNDRLSSIALGMGVGAAFGAGSKFFPEMMAGATTKLRVGTATEEAAMMGMAARIDRTGALQKESSKLALGATVGARMVARAENIMQSIANGYSPLDKLGERLRTTTNLAAENNPHMATSIVKAGDHTVRQYLYKTPLDALTRKPIVGAKSMKAVWASLADDPAKVARGAAYLVAERIVGRGESAVLGDAGRFAEAMEAAQAGRKDPVLVQLAKDHREYYDRLGQYAVDSGLWSHDQWRAILDSDALYIPMKRIIDSEARVGGGVLSGSQGMSVGAGVRSFTGSLRDIADPLKATAEYTAAIIKRSDRQRVIGTLFAARDAMGEAGNLLISPDIGKPNAANLGPAPHVIHTAGSPATTADAMRAVVQMGAPMDAVENLTEAFRVAWDEKNPPVWQNLPTGGREVGRIQMPDIAKAVMAMNESNVPDTVVRRALDSVLLPLRRGFTATATSLRVPFTVGAAVMRYGTDAVLRSRYGVRELGDLAKGYGPGDLLRGYGTAYVHAFGQLLGGDGVADVNALMHAGLGGASAYDMPVSAGSATRAIAPSSRLDQARTMAGVMGRAVLSPLEAFSHGADLGPRLAESFAAERRLAPKLAAGQITPEGMMMERATAARDASVDFANRGTSKASREIARYAPFFSAALNAGQSLGAAAARNPKRVGAVLGTLGMGSLGAWAWNKLTLDDAAYERFKDRPATERTAAIEFAAKDGSVGLRIPIGNDVGMVHVGITAALDKAFDNDPHSMGFLLTGLRRMLPPGVGDLLTGNYLGAVPIPGVQQLIENGYNRRAYGGNAVEPQHLQSLPDAERRFDSTRPTFDAMASFARATLPGAQHTSPLQAENFARGLLGNATEIATPLVDKLATRWMGTTAPPPAIPTAGYNRMLDPRYAFHPDAVVGSAESENDYYAQRTAVEQASKFLSTQEASSQPNVGRVMPYLKNGTLNPASMSIVQASDGALKDVRDHEQQIRDAVAAKAMTPDQARGMLDNLTLVRQHITRMASSQLRQVGVAP